MALAFAAATLAVSTRAANSAAVAVNAERSKELLAKELRKRQCLHDPPAQQYRVPQFLEAIDGVAVDGSPLAIHLRSQAEAASLRAERAVAAADWRSWIEPAAMQLAHEYIAFVDDLRDAQDYHADNGQFFAQMSDAVATRWSPDVVLKRVAASKLLQPTLRESMELAAQEGRTSPLSTAHAPAVWSIFFAGVRTISQAAKQQDDAEVCADGGSSGGGGRGRWRQSLQYRLLRRMRSTMERQRRFSRRFPSARRPPSVSSIE